MSRSTTILAGTILLAGILASSGGAGPRDAESSSTPDLAPPPVLVELFTSEGCSSCPPADALLRELVAGFAVEGARVVPLGYHVTYWDRLGWRDRFSDPAWTRRQEEYARAFGAASVYTPQVVVDGSTEMVGSRESELRGALRAASRRRLVPLALRATRNRDRIELALTLPEGLAARDAEAWVALTESGLATDVERGENASRRLRHVAVVRARRSLGAIGPGDGPIDLPRVTLELDDAWVVARLDAVAVVQRRGPGAVLALATSPVVTAGPVSTP